MPCQSLAFIPCPASHLPSFHTLPVTCLHSMPCQSLAFIPCPASNLPSFHALPVTCLHSLTGGDCKWLQKHLVRRQPKCIYIIFRIFCLFVCLIRILNVALTIHRGIMLQTCSMIQDYYGLKLIWFYIIGSKYLLSLKYGFFFGGLRMFTVGCGIQGAIKLFGSLGRNFRTPGTFLKSLFQRENLRLGAFLGCFVAIFRAVNCLLRWICNQENKLHGLLSGFLAGWSMLFYKGPTVALYTATKLAEVLYFKGIAAGVLPYIRCADIIIYSISTAMVFHAAVIEPHNLRPAYWSFLLRVTNNKFAEMNRALLEPYIEGCSKMFPNFWPGYDPRYTSLARR
ncbi:hypothetical protein ACJMK2_027579 [Sinanodonta woodiana]|uniref:Transmembrane protein 135 n=1 Tax=Sinanodonta woodiana TaxID=1069815 RepID=A0ABD3X6K4_SINWO